MPKNQPEFDLQVAVCQYLRLQYSQIPFLSDVRASTRLTIPQQVRSKKIQADGFACPDMMIFYPTASYAGLFLELKSSSPYKKNGDLKSDKHLENQQRAIDQLRALGYKAEFVWDIDEAKYLIDRYVEGL